MIYCVLQKQKQDFDIIELDNNALFAKGDRCVRVRLGCIVVGCSKNLSKCITAFILLILDTEWSRLTTHEIMKKKPVHLSPDCLIYTCITIYNIYTSNIILGITVSCRSQSVDCFQKVDFSKYDIFKFNLFFNFSRLIVLKRLKIKTRSTKTDEV